MDSAGTEAQRGEFGRCDRARGEQEGQRRALRCQRCHQWKHRVGLAYARGVKPSKPSRGPLDGWLPQSLVASQRLFLAAARAQTQEQRRQRARITRQLAVDPEPQPRTAVFGARTARGGAAQLAACPIVGLLRRKVEAVLHLLPVRLELLGGRLA